MQFSHILLSVSNAVRKVALSFRLVLKSLKNRPTKQTSSADETVLFFHPADNRAPFRLIWLPIRIAASWAQSTEFL